MPNHHLMLTCTCLASQQEQCVIHDMASTLDYRRLASQTRGLYFVGPNSNTELQERFEALSEGAPVGKASVSVAMGRQLAVPVAAGGWVRVCM